MLAPEKPFTMADYITGEKFEQFCDVDCEKNKQYRDAIKVHSAKVLTVFCQTHELKNIVPFLAECVDKKFIVVSHNSDGVLNYHESGRWFDYQWKPVKNILYWFSQNVDIFEPNVIPIPIAIENEYVFKPEVKQRLMLDLVAQNIPKQNKMFICMNPGTCKPQRELAYRIYENTSWATCQGGFNNPLMIKSYFDSLIRHQFVLACDGNGLDTIRAWEALYTGAIPIVFRHVFTEYFAKYLPMIVIDSYDILSEQFLMDRLAEFQSREFNWGMLRMSYWKDEITKRKIECGG